MEIFVFALHFVEDGIGFMKMTGEGTEDTDPFGTGERRVLLPLVDINGEHAEFLQPCRFQIVVLPVVDSQQRIESGLQHPFGTRFHTVAQVYLITLDRRVDQFGIAYRRQAVDCIYRIEKSHLHRAHRTEPTHRFAHTDALVRLKHLHHHARVRLRDLKSRGVLVAKRDRALLSRLRDAAYQA